MTRPLLMLPPVPSLLMLAPMPTATEMPSPESKAKRTVRLVKRSLRLADVLRRARLAGWALALALFVGCGDVATTAMLTTDGGDGGQARAGGSTGMGGAGGSCAPGSEGCPCYGNDTCDGALTCASHLCVKLGGSGAGGSIAGRGGTTGGGGESGGAGGTTGAGGSGCPNGTFACPDGACIPPGGDGTLKHCGGCDACQTGATACNVGVCGCSVASLMLCGMACVDTGSSASHCGGCDQPCTGGDCMNGTCIERDGGV